MKEQKSITVADEGYGDAVHYGNHLKEKGCTEHQIRETLAIAKSISYMNRAKHRRWRGFHGRFDPSQRSDVAYIDIRSLRGRPRARDEGLRGTHGVYNHLGVDAGLLLPQVR